VATIKSTDPVTCALTFASITELLQVHAIVHTLTSGITSPLREIARERLVALDAAMNEASDTMAAGSGGDRGTVWCAAGGDARGSYMAAGFGSGLQLPRATVPYDGTALDKLEVIALRKLEASLLVLVADVRAAIRERG
jgi:hypothetical protein